MLLDPACKKKINSPTCNPSTFFKISYYHRFVHVNAIGHTSPHDFCLFRRPWVVFVYSSKSWHDKKLGEMFLPLVLGIFCHFPLTKLRNKHCQPHAIVQMANFFPYPIVFFFHIWGLQLLAFSTFARVNKYHSAQMITAFFVQLYK